MAIQIKEKIFLWTLVLVGGALIFFVFSNRNEFQSEKDGVSSEQKAVEEEKWKTELTPEQFAILREKDTERPFSSSLNDEKRPGTYYAVDTKEAVYRSEDKFDSGTGWPSFTRPIKPEAIVTAEDSNFGFKRTEVLSTAGGHLGHVFTDGPEPTGLRYCINGAALYFVPDE